MSSKKILMDNSKYAEFIVKTH